MNRTVGRWAALILAGAAITIGVGPAQAQSSGTSTAKPQAAKSSTPAARPVRRGRIYKRPLVDLEKQAHERRPGQVMPGDPPREKFAPPPAPPAPHTPPVEQKAAHEPPPTPIAIPPNDATRDSSTGQMLKEPPTPVDPNSGPRGGAPASVPTPSPATSPESEHSHTASFESGLSPMPGSETASVGEAAVAPRDSLQTPTTVATGGPAPAAQSTATVYSITNEPADASVRVVSAGASGAEWRALGGAWRPLAAGDAATGRFEVRTGVDGHALIEFDGRVAVFVPPLSRITIARRSADSPEAVFTIARGAIELRAASGGGEGGSQPVQSWVCTPDRTAGFESLPGVRIGYSAFSGTKIGRPMEAFR